jgi:hypothetical protein
MKAIIDYKKHTILMKYEWKKTKIKNVNIWLKNFQNSIAFEIDCKEIISNSKKNKLIKIIEVNKP